MTNQEQTLEINETIEANPPAIAPVSIISNATTADNNGIVVYSSLV